jgi:rubrerythrin
MGHWTLDDIPWDRFDASRVDPDILKVIKAASMVEGQSRDYAGYLCNVFSDDPEFQKIAREWAEEEVQHGEALARWAKLADPDFDFEGSMSRFVEGHKLQLSATSSIRGSLTGELIARCVVETGTSSYYTALREATEEPVLKELCHQIAADELRHYKVFYTHMKRYLEKEQIPLWRRIWVVMGRVFETSDDELPYAFYCGNSPDWPYERKRGYHEYASRAYSFYRPHHIARVVAMLFKAAGLKPWGRVSLFLSRLANWLLRDQVRRWKAALA